MKTFLSLSLSLLGSAALAQTPTAAFWSPKVFSPQELRQDFDSLHTRLQRTPAQLHGRISPRQAERRWQTARAQLTRPMTRREFLLLTVPLTTQYQGSHPALYLDAEDAEGQAYDQHGRLFFPLNVRVKDGQLYAVNALNGQRLKPGARITRLNGVPTAQLLAQLKPYWKHDNQADLESTLSRYFNTSLWFVRGWGQQTEVEFVNDGARKAERETLAGVPYARVAPYIYPGRPQSRLRLPAPERLAGREFNGFANTPARDLAEGRNAALEYLQTTIRAAATGSTALVVPAE